MKCAWSLTVAAEESVLMKCWIVSADSGWTKNCFVVVVVVLVVESRWWWWCSAADGAKACVLVVNNIIIIIITTRMPSETLIARLLLAAVVVVMMILLVRCNRCFQTQVNWSRSIFKVSETAVKVLRCDGVNAVSIESSNPNTLPSKQNERYLWLASSFLKFGSMLMFCAGWKKKLFSALFWRREGPRRSLHAEFMDGRCADVLSCRRPCCRRRRYR